VCSFTPSPPAAAKWVIKLPLGHQIEPPVPSLFTFNVLDDRLKDLAGVSVESVRLRLSVDGKTQLEQLAIANYWGLSGPAVLKLSGVRVLHDHLKQLC